MTDLETRINAKIQQKLHVSSESSRRKIGGIIAAKFNHAGRVQRVRSGKLAEQAAQARMRKGG